MIAYSHRFYLAGRKFSDPGIRKILLKAQSTSSRQPRLIAELAAELGADDYGMRRYVMAFLRAGPSTDQDPEATAEIQRGHMAHMRQMAEDGHLVMAGPIFWTGGDFAAESLSFAVDTLGTSP